MVKFYSQEWCDQVCAAMNSNEYYLENTKKYLNFKWINFITDCPSGVDKLVRVELKEGRCLGYKVEEKPSPSDWRENIPDREECFAVITGTYNSYAMINRREMAPMQAVTRKIYKIEAPMGQFMAIFARLVMWNDVILSVPCEYE